MDLNLKPTSIRADTPRCYKTSQIAQNGMIYVSCYDVVGTLESFIKAKQLKLGAVRGVEVLMACTIR